MISVDPDTQVSGTPSKSSQEWPPELKRSVRQLREICEHEEDFRRHAGFGVLEDSDLVRFLLARNCDVDKASIMLRRALTWRTRRMPYWSLANPETDLAEAFAKEMETGKISIRGRDRFGRGVLVLDNSVQNTTDCDAHMRLLAYAVEAARRACAPGVDKLCVAVNLEAFTLRNAVPRKVILESIEILTIVYPEILGNCILWQPPGYAMAMYKLFKPMLDARTLQKLNFVSGDSRPGGEVDRILTEVVGDDWRNITGLSAPPLERRYSKYFGREIDCSNGFKFESFWSGQLKADRDHSIRVGGPPWRHLPRDFALDKASWDGAYPEYWRWSLPHEHANTVENPPIFVTPSVPGEVIADKDGVHHPKFVDIDAHSVVSEDEEVNAVENGVHLQKKVDISENSVMSDDQEEVNAVENGVHLRKKVDIGENSVMSDDQEFATPPQSDGESPGHSMKPTTIGRIYSPRLVQSLPDMFGRAGGHSERLSHVGGCLLRVCASRAAVLSFSLLSLLLSAMLAAVSAAAILLEETDWDPNEEHQEGAFSAFWTMTLLDLPCVVAAVSSLMCYSGPIFCPTKAHYFPRSLLLLRCFSFPEAFRSLLRSWSSKHHQHHRRLSSMFPCLDSLLTLVLACLWVKRIADAENSYVKVPTSEFQLDT